MNRIISLAAAVATGLLLFFLISCTLSPSWSVQRRIYINAKPEAVMPYVSTAAKWKKWNIWAKKAGVTDAAIEEQKSGEVQYRVTLKNKETMQCLVMVTASDLGTCVFVKVDGATAGSPLKRYLISARANRLGDELEAGLIKLKKIAEKN
jgi:hypothetical protein